MKSRSVITAAVWVIVGFIIGIWVRGDSNVTERLDRIDQRLEGLERQGAVPPAKQQRALEVAEGYSTLTISRAYWIDSPERREAIPTSEFKVAADGSGHLFVHVDEVRNGDGVSQYRSFYDRADKAFVLRADGEEEISVRAERGMYRQEFYLRIPPAEFSKMTSDVVYSLEPLNRSGPVTWTTRGTITLVRPEAVVLSALPAAECSSEPLEVDYGSLGTAAGGPACARSDTRRWSAGAPRSPCASSLDCAPFCCACPTDGRYAATSWCDHGRCSTPDEACCALLGTPTLSCGNR